MTAAERVALDVALQELLDAQTALTIAERAVARAGETLAFAQIRKNAAQDVLNRMLDRKLAALAAPAADLDPAAVADALERHNRTNGVAR